MKKRILFFTLSILVVGGFIFTMNQKNSKSEIEILREKHANFLKNSPYKESKKLSKSERKNLGLPPNAYNEQVWELTMDPNTGRPMPERIYKLQKELQEERKNISAKGGAGDSDFPWVDRGPNNIGGRTRGIMFDPNDNTNKRVFAGGVSGGLWVNNDITDANSSWSLVPGIGANISVTAIISDPNNSNNFYIGSGESYSSGQAVGRGIWKSTDAGLTWVNIFGGYDSSDGGQLVNGIFYVNDIVARNVNGVTELYAAIAGAFYQSSGSPSQFNGLLEQGLYKSTDDGFNWTKFEINDGANPENPNDIELDLDNNIWFTTTRSSFGTKGGKLFRSTDGNIFTLVRTIPNVDRTELEPSSLNVNNFWVAVNGPGGADLYRTGDSFVSIERLSTEPNDADNGIPAADYTRGQAFYDLPIEVDSNDNLYVGGIDLFRSNDSGDTWTQISKWSNNPGLNGLNVPLVHADQHAIVFRPGTGNQNQVVFGNDGGIFYTPDVTVNQASLDITSRNKDYNVTQFYYGAIDPVDGANGDDFAGGTQDNGTPISLDSQSGASSFTDPFGGDGAFTEIDNSGEYMIQTYTGNSHRYVDYPNFTTAFSLTNQGGGTFINVAVLDKNLDVFYANATSGIERVMSFIPGKGTRSNFLLTNGLLNSTPSAMTISPYNTTASDLYIGLENGRLLKVEAANASNAPAWTNIAGGNFAGSISDIEFGLNNQEIFVTFHNYGVESIFFTNDGGASWRGIEGNLPDLPVKCILQNPLRTGELIIGTELGIWRTEDYTVSNPVWSQAYNGMSDVTVLDLDLRTSDNTILATTHGRGLFTSQFTANAASVDDVLAGKKVFTIYPTISDGNFTLFAKSSLGKTKMNIFNLNGKEVYKSNIDFNVNEKQEISVNLNAGVYIVNLVDENNVKTSSKIVIE